MNRARLAIDGCRLGNARVATTTELDGVAAALEAAGLVELEAWRGRARRTRGA